MSFEDFVFHQDDLVEIDNIVTQFVLQEEELQSTESQCTRKRISSSDSSDDDILDIHRKRKRRRVLSESESDTDETFMRPSSAGSTSNNNWSTTTGNRPRIIPFTESPGLKPLHLRHSMSNSSPEQFYTLLVPDEVFETIVYQTNLFAQQTISKTRLKPSSRLHKWKPTDIEEIKKMFGIIVHMGMVRLPSISLYWSNDPVFEQKFVKNAMSRNRFELLLRMLHFSNNEEAKSGDRLHKISPLISTLNTNFEKHFCPNESLCVDESLVPFRGRIIFRQYLKQKRHKYGIKVFKLCTIPGYTFKLEVYAGKQLDTENTTPTNVVLNLCKNLFHKGHTMYTDNWYTSVGLADKLLEADTHLVGTVRKNRKGLPKDVTQKKLKIGEYIARENEKGITVMKWRDKREVLLLSTKHTDNFRNITNKRGVQKRKPKIILDYNEAKSAVDLSDQMSAYSTPLRKTVKWYRKLGFELLLNTAVVNALVLYKQTTKKNISIVQFRRALVDHLMSSNKENQSQLTEAPRQSRLKHQLSRKEGKAKQSRRNCLGCYKKNVQTIDRQTARNKTKKVVTFCPMCPGKPHLCLECFNVQHR